MKECKNTRKEAICTVASIVFLFLLLFIGYIALLLQTKAQTDKAKATVEADSSSTVPVEQEIIKVNGGTIKEPIEADLSNFYSPEIEYTVYKDSVRGTVFAEVVIGRTGLLIQLVDSDGNDKPYSSEDSNRILVDSVSEDGSFYVLKDVDTNVQYIVSRYNSYLVR